MFFISLGVYAYRFGLCSPRMPDPPTPSRHSVYHRDRQGSQSQSNSRGSHYTSNSRSGRSHHRGSRTPRLTATSTPVPSPSSPGGTTPTTPKTPSMSMSMPIPPPSIPLQEQTQTIEHNTNGHSLTNGRDVHSSPTMSKNGNTRLAPGSSSYAWTEEFEVDAIFSAHSDGLMVILRRADTL